MPKRRQIILLSCMTIIVSLLLIVASTMALFTDEVNVTNHLQAGTLKITLIREKLVAKVLDDGLLIDKENPVAKDFTNNTIDNIFDIEASDKLVPGSKYEAFMRLENNSDVAYEYYLAIIVKTTDTNIAKELKVTITKEDDSPKVAYLNGGITIGSKSEPIGRITKGGKQKFSIAVEFAALADDVNNLAQAEDITFDVVVYATQAI